MSAFSSAPGKQQQRFAAYLDSLARAAGTQIAPYLFDPIAPVCYFPVNARVLSPWPRDWLPMMCGACINLFIIL